MGGTDSVILCQKPRTTVAQVSAWLDRGERKRVADFVQARFIERYFQPAESLDDREGSGFAIMALCCLVVESLECFHCGWETSNKKSERAFRQFFDREPTFSIFSDYAKEFYVNVRCGIHHQGETTGGWRIWKYGAIFVPVELRVNAKAFRTALRTSLDNYVESIQNPDADPALWINCEKKLRAIVSNCEK